jgi:broad specificity phosphatase PhoE
MKFDYSASFIVALIASFIPIVISRRSTFKTNKMKVDIFLVRHGETTANKAGILQGHCDYPLTDQGVQEAGKLGKALRDIRFDVVISSDLTRAIKTTELALLLKPSMSSIHLERKLTTELVREISFGVREALPRGTSVEEAIKIVAERDGLSPDEVVDAAETEEQLVVRQKEFMGYLFDELSLVESASLGRAAENNENNGVVSEVVSIEGRIVTLTAADVAGSLETAEDLIYGISRPRVLCVTHGGFIRRFLKNFCDVSSVEKVGNCSISVVTIDWTSRDDFQCTADLSRLNLMDHLDTKRDDIAD